MIDKNLENKIQEMNPYHAHSVLMWLKGLSPELTDLDNEIGNYDTCLVGENHGFSGIYANETTEFFCKECYRYANYLSEEYNRDNFQEFIKDLKKFYEHMETTDHKYEVIEE